MLVAESAKLLRLEDEVSRLALGGGNPLSEGPRTDVTESAGESSLGPEPQCSEGIDTSLALEARGSSSPTAPLEAREAPFPQWLWAPGILCFGFGDTLTSLMVFGAGGGEGNLLLGGVLRIVGPTLWAFLGIKTASTLGGVLISRLRPRVEPFGAMAMLLAGAFLVAQNLAILLS